MAQSWPGGLVAGVTGPDLVTVPYVSFSGSARFLDNSNPQASDSNSGTDPSFPRSTLASVLLSASVFDPIIVGAQHRETIVSTVTMTTANTIIGCVSGATMPTFTPGGGGLSMISVTTEAGGQFHNLRFAAGTGAAIKVDVQVSDTLFEECIFSQGASGSGIGIRNTGVDRTRLKGCVFTSIATGAVAGYAAAGNSIGFSAEDCIFDGSIYGWASYALSANSAYTKARLKNLQFLRGSQALFGTGSTLQQYKVFSDVGGNAITTS